MSSQVTILKLCGKIKGLQTKTFAEAEAVMNQLEKTEQYAKADRLHALYTKIANPFDLDVKGKKRAAGRFVRLSRRLK